MKILLKKVMKIQQMKQKTKILFQKTQYQNLQKLLQKKKLIQNHNMQKRQE